MHDALRLLDIKEEHKKLLYDKYVNDLSVDEIVKKHYLTKSTFYNKIKIAKDNFNTLVNNEGSKLPSDLRKILENCKRIL